jgi:hypothetical protein
MPIVAGDILLRFSGGSGNSDPNACLGGVMSTTTAITNDSLHNLFDLVTGAESSPGDTEYRGIYILNNHGSLTAKNVRVYISTDSLSDIDIALAGEGLNATMETIADESTAPAGESFTHPTTYAGGLAPADIPFGQRYGLWLRRTIAASQGAQTPYSMTLNVDCDTDA